MRWALAVLACALAMPVALADHGEWHPDPTFAVSLTGLTSPPHWGERIRITVTSVHDLNITVIPRIASYAHANTTHHESKPHALYGHPDLQVPAILRSDLTYGYYPGTIEILWRNEEGREGRAELEAGFFAAGEHPGGRVLPSEIHRRTHPVSTTLQVYVRNPLPFDERLRFDIAPSATYDLSADPVVLAPRESRLVNVTVMTRGVPSEVETTLLRALNETAEVGNATIILVPPTHQEEVPGCPDSPRELAFEPFQLGEFFESTSYAVVDRCEVDDVWRGTLVAWHYAFPGKNVTLAATAANVTLRTAPEGTIWFPTPYASPETGWRAVPSVTRIAFELTYRREPHRSQAHTVYNLLRVDNLDRTDDIDDDFVTMYLHAASLPATQDEPSPPANAPPTISNSPSSPAAVEEEAAALSPLPTPSTPQPSPELPDNVPTTEVGALQLHDPPAAQAADGMWWSAVAGTFGMVALGAGVFAKRNPLVFTVLFARLRGRAALESAQRRGIMDEVSGTPGIATSELQRRLALSNGQIDHHLKVLERVALIRRERSGRESRIFAIGTPSTPATDTSARVLQILRQGPRPVEELHSAIGCTRQTIHYHVRRLEAAGAVELRFDGLRLVASQRQ